MLLQLRCIRKRFIALFTTKSKNYCHIINTKNLTHYKEYFHYKFVSHFQLLSSTHNLFSATICVSLLELFKTSSK